MQPMSTYDETIDDIISASSVMAKEKYTKRYGRVFAQLHFNTCKEIGLKLDKESWYEHVKKAATKVVKVS